MSRFYFILWLKWAFGVTLSSVGLAAFVSFLITAIIYINHDMRSLNSEVYEALFSIFKFWFVLSWSVTILFAIFRSLKYVFNSCFGDYKMLLFSCENEQKSELIETIGYGDLVKIWRKWIMLLIWLVGTFMILTTVFFKLFGSFESVFDWFNIYILYAFILMAGYFSFIILSSKCKKIRIKKC